MREPETHQNKKSQIWLWEGRVQQNAERQQKGEPFMFAANQKNIYMFDSSYSQRQKSLGVLCGQTGLYQRNDGLCNRFFLSVTEPTP